MAKTKSYEDNFIWEEICEKRKKLLENRKAIWEKLFHKYSQPVLHEAEINKDVLTPEECSILKNNLPTVGDTEPKKVEDGGNINEIRPTRMIWSISSTDFSMAVINVVSNKAIHMKRHYAKNTNFAIKKAKLQGGKQFFIQTEVLDSESD